MQHTVIKEFIRRKYHFHAYFLALITGLVIVALGASAPIRAEDTGAEMFPPAAPLAVSAVVKEDEVSLSWQSAEAGSYPVSGYIISRRSGQGDFTEIGRQSGTAYEDREGRAGYEYQVTAFDDQNPPLLSLPSDTAKTEIPAPAATPPAPETALSPGEAASLGRSESSVPDEKLSILESGVETKSDTVLHTVFNQLEQGKDDLVIKSSHFVPAERKMAAQGCADQEGRLETLMSSLSENLQMKVIEVLARCQLLQ